MFRCQQHASWNDRFECSVQGNVLTVHRIDCKSGWGQQLTLRVQNHGSDRVQLLTTLEDLLVHYQKVEIMEGENKFRCAGVQCRDQLVERAERRTRVIVWPEHFVLSLKRFYYTRMEIFINSMEIFTQN